MGESKLAATLGRIDRDDVIFLHYRRVPRTRGNIDHIVVAPSGVYVVDAKRYRGRVEVRDVSGLFSRANRRLLKPGEVVPKGYAAFSVVVMADAASGPNSPRSLAVKLRQDDVDGWTRHALLRATAWGRIRDRAPRRSLPRDSRRAGAGYATKQGGNRLECAKPWSPHCSSTRPHRANAGIRAGCGRSSGRRRRGGRAGHSL